MQPVFVTNTCTNLGNVSSYTLTGTSTNYTLTYAPNVCPLGSTTFVFTNLTTGNCGVGMAFGSPAGCVAKYPPHFVVLGGWLVNS